jgi:gliding motility-associated-like protein
MRLRLLFTFLASVFLFISKGFSQNTDVFTYTGGVQTWTVPNCVTSIDVVVAGAQGGGSQIQTGTALGGQGAVITETISVNPGDVIWFTVGGEGGCGDNSAGFNGGGTGFASDNGNNNYNSCGGGGSTNFQLVNGIDYIIAAGGGGSGGGSVTNNVGGAGGCATGSPGGNTYGGGGGGGTQSNGGINGTPWAGTVGTPVAQAGSFGQGGNAGFWQTASSGGGGGGYYGGGGGGIDGCCTGANGGGGGGGGSSLVPGSATCNGGQNTGDGYVSFTYFGGLNATVSNTGPYCAGDVIELTGNGGANFAWTGPNGFTSNLQNPTIPNATVAMDGVYQLIVTDPNCPEIDTATMTVTVYPMPTVDPILDQTICDGSSTTAINFNGAVVTASYDWINDNTGTGLGANGNGPIPSFVGSAITNTEVSNITVTPSENGCTGATETFTITVLLDPTISVSNDTTVCENGTAYLVATAAGGGGGPYLYHWDQTIDTQANQAVNPLAASTYTVYAESTNGCTSDPASIDVSMYPPLSGTITGNDTVCPGYTTDISATVGGGIGQPYWFTWSSGETQDGPLNNQTITAGPPSTQDYTVTINDGCETTPLVMTTNIRVSPLPVPQYTVLDPIQCEPAVFHIINSTDPALSQYEYWEIDGIHQYLNEDTVVTPEFMAGDYEIYMMVTSYEGCIDSIRVEEALHVQDNPVANFVHAPNPVTAFNTEVEFQNMSFLGYTYQWYFEDGYPSSSTLEDPTVLWPDGVVETYDVMLITTSELGCVDTMRYELVVQPEVLIYAPNAFTPDGDEFNQGWRVFMEGIDIYDFELNIYNRWGETIWESHDIEQSWDATYGGQDLPTGTYVWTITTKDVLNDEKLTYRGHVNVLR